MDVESVILPITYRPIVLFSIGLWGWGLNLLLLSKYNIDPVALLQLHQTDKTTPLYKSIFFLSSMLSLIVLINLVLYWIYQSSTIAMFPYLSAIVLLLWPGKSFYRKERIRFIRMIKRVLSLNVFAPVFFSDIVFADMLTSFSNVFGDCFIATCVIFAGHTSSYFMDNTNNLFYRDSVVPFLISLPYLIRLKQCISDYIESKEKRHIFNALKYTSSIPVVIFSAVQRKAAMYVTESGTVPNYWYLKEDSIFRFWMLCVFINSMYSFWWDISMDWNLVTITFEKTQTEQHHQKTVNLPPQRQSSPIIHIRRQLYFSQPILYFLAIILDFLLRITWSLKLSSHIYIRKLDGSIFLMELLEVVRRWVWVVFRMESEWVKKVYNTLPNKNFENLRMSVIDRTNIGLLSPIVEEEDL